MRFGRLEQFLLDGRQIRGQGRARSKQKRRQQRVATVGQDRFRMKLNANHRQLAMLDRHQAFRPRSRRWPRNNPATTRARRSANGSGNPPADWAGRRKFLARRDGSASFGRGPARRPARPRAPAPARSPDAPGRRPGSAAACEACVRCRAWRRLRWACRGRAKARRPAAASARTPSTPIASLRTTQVSCPNRSK